MQLGGQTYHVDVGFTAARHTNAELRLAAKLTNDSGERAYDGFAHDPPPRTTDSHWPNVLLPRFGPTFANGVQHGAVDQWTEAARKTV